MHPYSTTQQLKTCTKCGQELPATLEFYSPQARGKDRLRNACKKCQAAAARLWYHANKDRSRQNHREWRRRNPQKKAQHYKKWYLANRERALEYSRVYRAKHPEQVKAAFKKWQREHLEDIREYNRAYREAHPERERKYQATYRRANPERAAAWRRNNAEQERARSRRRRAIRRFASGSHTASDVRSIYSEQAGRCAYCLIAVGDLFHVDHIIPLSRGGSDSPDNLAISCPSCNLSKGSKALWEWKATFVQGK